MNIHYPFGFDASGRTARAEDQDHVEDMIEQLLLTSPGERVNRPELGVPLKRLCFEGNSPQVASAVQCTIQAALQRWLGDIIEVQPVQTESEDSVLRIFVTYVIRRTGQGGTKEVKWRIDS
jgi:phage baseplate assembly protein W